MNKVVDKKVAERRRILTGGVLLVLLTVLVFANTFKNDFVGYDDQNIIQNNPTIRSLSIKSVAQMFVPRHKGNYQPMRTLSYALDYSFWGDRPFGFHLTNLILHALTVVGVWFLLRRLFEEPVPLFAAMIFAVHPVHVESVTWMSGRKDVLSLFFFLVAMLWYEKFESERKVAPYLVSILATFLALFSKLTAVSLPVCIVLLDICRDGWPSIREWGRKLLRLSPHFLVVFLVVGLNFMRSATAPSHGDSLVELGTLSPAVVHDVWLSMPLVVCRYIRILLFPYGLSTHYDVARVSHVLDPKALVPAVVLLGGLAIGIACFLRGRRRVAFCIGWFVITFLPASNIVPTAVMMGDRYMHAPSIGFAALLAMTLVYPLRQFARDGKPAARVLTLFPFFIVVVFLSVLTIRRNGDWRDTLTLFTRTQAVNPRSIDAYLGIGAIYDEAGDYESAIRTYQRALEIEPDQYRVLFNLGVSYLKKGWIHQATKAFEAATAANPAFPAAHLNLALCYHEQKRYEEAIAEYRKVQQLDPGNAQSHGDLGRIYMETGALKEALEELNRALEIDPDLTPAIIDRATLLIREKRYAEAEKDIRRLESLGVGTRHLWAEMQLAPGSNPAAQEN